MASRFTKGLMAACLTLPLLHAAAKAEPLNVVAFAGASNWPFWVGEAQGFFAKEGLEPKLDITPNSIEMAKNLHASRYDLALTSVDNIVAYDEGQGEANLEGPASFVALFGVDNGLLNVMATPDIKSFADLKGKTVSVDAMTTGFAFVLREALTKHGIKETDVQWVKVGGGAQRLEALLKKEQAATLLNSPLDLAAEAKGFTRLLHARDEFGAYQGIVGATTQHTAKDKRKQLVAFIRAFHASVAWLADPANKEAALQLFTSKMRGMERPAAEKAYTVLLDPKEGLYRDLKIDPAGMTTILRLRSTYAEPKKNLSDPSRYIDDSLRQEAMAKSAK